jgi:lysozyme family protein
MRFAYDCMFKAYVYLEHVMTNFDFAFHYTLDNEGGYTNIVEDRGGPTNWGITQGDLSMWRKSPVSADDVRLMSKDEAKLIYKHWYWDTLNLDLISFPKCVAIFDIGVVRGIYKSARYAQMACNANGYELRIDGHIGRKSMFAINLVEVNSFISAFSELSLEGFRGIVERNPSQKIFLRGWENRANRLKTLLTSSEPQSS